MKNKGRANQIYKQLKARVQLDSQQGKDPMDTLARALVETIARVEVLEQANKQVTSSVKPTNRAWMAVDSGREKVTGRAAG